MPTNPHPQQSPETESRAGCPTNPGPVIIPHDGPRVETGAVQFGSDWPGLFIRGDNAAGIAMNVRSVIRFIEEKAAGDLRMAFALSDLKWLASTIEGDVIVNHETAPSPPAPKSPGLTGLSIEERCDITTSPYPCPVLRFDDGGFEYPRDLGNCDDGGGKLVDAIRRVITEAVAQARREEEQETMCRLADAAVKVEAVRSADWSYASLSTSAWDSILGCGVEMPATIPAVETEQLVESAPPISRERLREAMRSYAIWLYHSNNCHSDAKIDELLSSVAGIDVRRGPDMELCPDCGGDGLILSDECKTCGGRGEVATGIPASEAPPESSPVGSGEPTHEELESLVCQKCGGTGMVEAPNGDIARQWPCDACKLFTERPVANCGHVGGDGLCTHPKNTTPECHVHICPMVDDARLEEIDDEPAKSTWGEARKMAHELIERRKGVDARDAELARLREQVAGLEGQLENFRDKLTGQHCPKCGGEFTTRSALLIEPKLFDGDERPRHLTCAIEHRAQQAERERDEARAGLAEFQWMKELRERIHVINEPDWRKCKMADARLTAAIKNLSLGVHEADVLTILACLEDSMNSNINFESEIKRLEQRATTAEAIVQKQATELAKTDLRKDLIQSKSAYRLMLSERDDAMGQAEKLRAVLREARDVLACDPKAWGAAQPRSTITRISEALKLAESRERKAAEAGKDGAGS